MRDLTILRTSLLIVRGADGVLRAFHNICRHRGNRLEKSCSGSTKSFFCGFHGWTYDTNGQLVHIPQEADFGAVKKEQLGLVPVALDTWEGFIFINVDPTLQETLTDYLGAVATCVSGFPRLFSHTYAELVAK